MKKNFIYALMSAIALTGVVGFSSCSSSEETADVNPNYNPVTNEVTTQFVFNVSAGNTSKTRMTAGNTQASVDQAFRGIEKTQLFAYKLTGGDRVITERDADKTYNLGNILSPGQLDPDGTTTKSQRIIELALPLETTSLMFWGKAPQSDADPNNKQGKILFNASSNSISSHAFSLVPRVASGSAEATKLSHYQEVLVILINQVVNSKYTAAAENCVWSSSSNGDGSKNTTAINLLWSDLIDVDASSKALSKSVSTTEVTRNDATTVTVCTKKSLAECPLGEILVNAFISFNTLYSNEVRAGSGEAVKHMMADLQTVVGKVADATATSYDEFVVKQLGIEIRSNIRKIVDASGNMQDYPTLKTNAGVTYADIDSPFDVITTGTSSVGFPANLGLPDGALQLTVAINTASPVATWSYATTSGPTNFSYNLNNFTYPAEICYFGNSPIRVTNDSHVAADYPDGASDWTDDGNTKWSTWTKNGKVLSSTRSVAMQENINYGTALLKTTVGIKDGITLYDNNAVIQKRTNPSSTEANKAITPSGNLFTLTGVLVGGQAKTVGWNYLPTSTTFDHVIFDKEIASSAVPSDGGKSGANYTLVWDNYNSGLAANAQSPVYVALEFKNAAGNFWGESNLIRNNEKFYLIGKLTPIGDGKNTVSTGEGSSITWPSYPMPPYDSTSGLTIEAPRVFIQDFVTTANFVIDTNSLQHAYNTVPDLRSSQISLGLSVDLEWQKGLTFESTLGN